MFFFPLYTDAEFRKLPWVTIMVCLLCFLIYCWEETSHARGKEDCEKFLSVYSQDDKATILGITHDIRYTPCGAMRMYTGFYKSPENREAFIQRVLNNNPLEVAGHTAEESWNKFVFLAGEFEHYGFTNVNFMLSYHKGSYNILQMISSVFAHADRSHLFFNLVFFWAFGCVVELIIGSRFFILLILSTAIIESIIFNSVYRNTGALMGLGLSGVCMCMMGALFTIHPKAKIKTFVWVLALVRVIPVSAYWFALWYVGWDLYDTYHPSTYDSTNHSAHLTGAFIGATFGLFYRWKLTHDEARKKPVSFYD